MKSGIRLLVAEGARTRILLIPEKSIMPSIQKTTTQDMELPIAPLAIDGPAVRGMKARKEENNNKQIEVVDLVAAYNPIKAKVIDGLMKLAAIAY